MWKMLILIFMLCVWRGTAQPDADDDYDEMIEESDVAVRTVQTSAKESQFVGTNLLGLSGARKRCFTNEDVALLVARKEYEVSEAPP